MKNCTQWYIRCLLCASVLVSSFSSGAQTTLSPGDVVFTSYNATPSSPNADVFSFVLLTNISSGTTIGFTDRGYNASLASWYMASTGEGTVTWTSGSALPAGTEIVIQGLTAYLAANYTPPGGGVSNGTIAVTEGNYQYGLNLVTSGDQIIAFQGGGGSVSGGGVTLIAGLHYGTCGSGNTTTATWDAACGSMGTTASNMPPGLTGGTTAFYTGTVGGAIATSGRFNCTGVPAATAAAVRVAVMSQSNWMLSTNVPSTLTFPSGCTFLGTAPVVTGNPANRTVCAPGNTTFSVTATGAIAYQWHVNSGSGFSAISNGGVYSGATTATLSLTGATAGMSGYQYRVVVTGAAGSATSNAGSLTVYGPTVGGRVQTNIACNGGANGVASISSVTGGAAPYTYSWSPAGGTAATATGLVAGAYTVTITDNYGCQVSQGFTITQPSAIATSWSQTNIACNGGANGAASVTASGGAGGYSYSWSPAGGTNSIATGLSAGAYTVSVTDANGCIATRNYTITQPPAIATSGSQTNIACNGGSNGLASVVASGGVGGYSYSWSPSGGTAATATGLAAGVYTVTVTDANACIRTRQFTIIQPSAITSSVSSTSPSCLNGNSGSATVSANGGAGGYSYNWSPTGGTAATATNLSTGNYNVTITDANGCTRVQSATIGSSTPSQQGGVAGSAGSSASQTQPVATASGSYTDGNCNRIATLTPSGTSPVSGSVATKVWVQGAVPNHVGAPYVARHYEITPANNPTTATGTVTLYFLQSEFDDFNAAPGSLRKLPTGAGDATGIANLRIGKYSGTSSDNTGRPSTYTGSAVVINPADNNIVWNATEGRWEVSFDVEGFSGFFAQSSPAILPVTLRSFTATKVDGSVALQWNTATEQATARFDVERSADGRGYNKLGSVAAAGNSTTGNSYAYTDAQPLAVNYYRIKMIDRDGAFTYSPVAVVKMSDKGSLDIFPNPAKGVVRVQLPNSQETTLEVYNVAGRLVKSVSVARNSGNLVSLDLSGLAQGHYYLKAGSETVKFTKE